MEGLINERSHERIARTLERASGFRARMQGLLGRDSLPLYHALWISPCSAIHTVFMRFPIDAIFVDRNLKVVSIFQFITSGRVIFGGWKSHSVFELKGGQLKYFDIEEGDQLYVMGH